MSDAESKSFVSWYRQKLGQHHWVVQAMAWLFYGYLWIPCWWLASVGRTKTAIAVGSVGFVLVLAFAQAHREQQRANNSNFAQSNRQAARSPRNKKGRLSSFGATPPPVEAAIQQGSKVIELVDCWFLKPGDGPAQSLIYVVFDGERLQSVIVKSFSKGAEAELLFKEDSVIEWSVLDLAKEDESPALLGGEQKSSQSWSAIDGGLGVVYRHNLISKSVAIEQVSRIMIDLSSPQGGSWKQEYSSTRTLGKSVIQSAKDSASASQYGPSHIQQLSTPKTTRSFDRGRAKLLSGR